MGTQYVPKDSIIADYVSVLTGGSNNFATTSEHLNALQTDILNQGVTGTIGNTAGVAPATGSLACNAQGTPNMTIAVTAGKAYVTATPTSQSSQLLRANIAAQNATIAANSTGGTRYDWIYVTISAANAANPNVAGDNVASITVSRSTSSSVDNGTPPTYGYNIAMVTVANGASSITNGNITDRRSVVSFSASGANDGWTTAEATPNTVTANGNRSYDLLFNSIDLTDTISPGMRLKMTRTSTAPTQCTDLESSSSQYFSRATGSVSGMTFTDDWTVSAWIKLESYTAGRIASRYNGTSGWEFRVDATGAIAMFGYNAGAGNYSGITTYTSVPLGRWVHVAAQVDMSTFTATTTTSYVMFDGLDVPSAVSRGGTNPTALVQAGDLQIGASNTTSFFDGKIAQVAIYSAKVPQATILASMNQTLTGSETSLVAAYTFNNSLSDLSANANTLTANAGAVATDTDTPFAGGNVSEFTDGTVEMGIVTKTAFSTNTTLTVQVPQGYAIPTSGGISAMSYSSQKTPYGFPSKNGIFNVEVLVRGVFSVAIGAINVWYPGAGVSLKVPVGYWNVGLQGTCYQSSNVAGVRSAYFTIASSAPTNAVWNGDRTARVYSAASAVVALANLNISKPENITSLSTFLVYGGIDNSTGTETYTLDGAASYWRAFAEFQYV